MVAFKRVIKTQLGAMVTAGQLRTMTNIPTIVLNDSPDDVFLCTIDVPTTGGPQTIVEHGPASRRMSVDPTARPLPLNNNFLAVNVDLFRQRGYNKSEPFLDPRTRRLSWEIPRLPSFDGSSCSDVDDISDTYSNIETPVPRPARRSKKNAKVDLTR